MVSDEHHGAVGRDFFKPHHLNVRASRLKAVPRPLRHDFVHESVALNVVSFFVELFHHAKPLVLLQHEK